MFSRKTLISISSIKRCMFSQERSHLKTNFFSRHKLGIGMAGAGLTLSVGIAYTGYSFLTGPKIYAKDNLSPDHKPTKSMKSATDNTGLKLKLYQYQTCPFCCKVRAYLDYYGFEYDIVEVNSVTRAQTKWSTYKKVPILVVEDKSEGFVQLNDSSVIMSVLETYLEDRNVPFEKILSFYPGVDTTNERGKKITEFPNRYFVMYGEKKCPKTYEQMKEERKWRDWVDSDLVHMLSPNVYRTPKEALQAFRYFSEVGEWEKNFSTAERLVVIYLGATAMYILGKVLAHRYKLKSDVRESLYGSLNHWIKGLKNDDKFMGGATPNLADLSAYGVLCSIEGCAAFQDALKNTKIKKWFYDTKAIVESHAGAGLMSKTS